MKQTIKRTFERGFTLIELLIVIALLGALAIGLIGAIDPFEQLKKGTDTGTRNSVSEVQGSIIRYFALKGWMPWCTTESNCDTITSLGLSQGNMAIALSRIVDSGELKTDFTLVNSSQLGKIFVTASNGNQSVAVCYQPTAKSFQSDANTKYFVDGASDDSCPRTGINACYWCVK